METFKQNMIMLNTKYKGYLAGEDGFIYSLIARRRDRSKPYKLAPGRGSSKYLQVNLRIKRGKYGAVLVHSLICETFHGPRPIINNKKYTCSHINGNIDDNRPANLTWESQSDNVSRKYEHGTADCGYYNGRAKLSKEDLISIRNRLAAGHLHQNIADDYNVAGQQLVK